jgi:hypothetical protein
MTANAPPPPEFQFKEKNFCMQIGMLNAVQPELGNRICPGTSPGSDGSRNSWVSRDFLTYRVDLDQVGIPSVTGNFDIVIAGLAFGTSAKDVPSYCQVAE